MGRGFDGPPVEATYDYKIIMVAQGTSRTANYPRYAGLRMSADEFLAMDDDGFRYELVNGVVLMSPPLSFEHQELAINVLAQLLDFVRPRGLGKVQYEAGIRFTADLVYQADIVFYAGNRAAGTKDRLTIAPDFVIEFLSPRTRAKDLNTKRDDYARHGVREYWAIGMGEAFKFVLRGSKFVAEEITGDRIASEVLAGFVLDLKAARAGVSEDAGSGSGDV